MSTQVEPKKKQKVPFDWRILHGSDAWLSDAKSIRALDAPTIIDGMLREGEVVSIIGGAKTYKTWFSLAMAYAVANGDSFIGKDVLNVPVCYLDYELKLNSFRKRLSIVAPDIPQNLDFQCLRATKRLPRIGEIKDLIINNNYKFVVIDSLYRTGWLSEENSNDSTSKELGDLQGLAEETGAAIMIVDHTAKGGGKDKQVVDAARGASAKAGFFDSMFFLRPDKEDQRVIVDMVLRDWPAPKESPIVEFDFNNYQLTTEVVGKSSKGDKNGHRSEILEMLAQKGSEGISYADLSLPEETARRNLKALIKDGLIEEFKKPNEHKQRKFFRLIDKGF
ncbi:AAA family ATPase [Akkermansiaceae bacterium]|nr:AAA family ATPase [Akkermansiaceae bacterium]MDB4414625.1 AAA family ATPase [bacterium]MDB4781941.1 AAA family ATPase [Akkermansiaceae bacterium]